jgi:hypothetical protein
MNQAPDHEDVCRSGSIAPPFFNSELDGGKLSASRSSRFTPGEGATGTNCIGGWVGPKASLDFVEKRKGLFPLPEIELGPSSQ